MNFLRHGEYAFYRNTKENICSVHRLMFAEKVLCPLTVYGLMNELNEH
jgi:hypothetical protein